MRGLVGDDVVGEARERHAARHAVGGGLGTGWEVAEEKCLLRRVVVGVLLAEGVRVDAEALHAVVLPLAVLGIHVPVGPEDLAAESALEVLDRVHCDSVDHLLVELGIAL